MLIVTAFLHFCDYLPLDKNLAHLLNNFNSFYLRMIDTKFDWNWPADSGEKDFFIINMVSPIVAPHDPWGPWFEPTWIYIISGRFHVNTSSSGSVVLEKISKWPHPILVIISPLKKTWPLICTIVNSLYLRMIVPSVTETGLLVLENKIL
jgi:hypothetical protein